MGTAKLRWKDGREEDAGGLAGMYIIKPHRIGDRVHETTFAMDKVLDSGDVLYVEEKTEDVNAKWLESEARRMVERAFREGIALPRYILQGSYPGETKEEFERRIEILRPAVEGSQRQSVGEEK